MKESAFRARFKKQLEDQGCYVRVNEAHFIHGFPDLTVLCPTGKVVFSELKVAPHGPTKLQLKTLQDLANHNGFANLVVFDHVLGLYDTTFFYRDQKPHTQSNLLPTLLHCYI